MEMIKTVDLHKSFGALHVLRGVTETIHKGEAVSIIGPSGGGKSTFLRCLNLLEVPEQGQIFFEGAEITGKKVDVDRYRQKMGMVFQQFNVFPHLSVAENITLAPKMLKGKSEAEATEMAKDLLDRVGLLSKFDEMPGNLSGGQKQRLAIVRALAMHPEVMLFDEPTSALDPEMVKEVLNVISDLTRSGMTILIVTHEMAFARDVADQVMFMDGGVIVEKGEAHQVIEHPQQERTRQFLSRYAQNN